MESRQLFGSAASAKMMEILVQAVSSKPTATPKDQNASQLEAALTKSLNAYYQSESHAYYQNEFVFVLVFCDHVLGILFEQARCSRHHVNDERLGL